MPRRLTLLVVATVVAGLGLWLVRSPDALAPLAQVSPVALGRLAVASGAALLAQAAQFALAARLFGLRLRPSEWVGLTCVNNMLAYALPVRGGTLVRAAYLHRVHGFALHAYAALTISSHVVITGVLSILGMTFILAGAASALAPPRWMVIGFAAAPLVVGAAAWLLVALSERLAAASPRLGSHARAFRAGLGTWRHRPLRALAFVLISAGVVILHAVRMWVAFEAVGLGVPWAGAFLVHAAAAASAVVAVTPANVGTREAVVGVMAGTLGFDARAAVLAALVERAMAMLEAVVGTIVLGRGLQRRLRAVD